MSDKVLAEQTAAVKTADEFKNKLVELPDDALPDIEELTGDLRLLAELAGVKIALMIIQVVGGTILRLPKIDRFLRRQRDRCIRRDYDAGMSVTSLARKYKLSERQIWNILGTADEDERQMKLFG